MMNSQGPLLALLLFAAAITAAMLPRPDRLSESMPSSPRATNFADWLPPDPRIGLLAQRSEAKAKVVAQLLQGTITLAEAGIRFQSIGAGLPTPVAYTHAEACRQVISWADSLLDDEEAPNNNELILALEADFECLHGSGLR